MQLTDKQIKQLQMSRALRGRAPTLGWYLLTAWRTYLLILLAGVAAICFYLWAGWPYMATFFAGLLIATLLRDLKWYRQFANGWPLSDAITNWERVDELLANQQASAP